MKIRIIELLEMIANGQKPPKKIAFREQEYEYDIGERDYYYCNGAIYWLFDEYVITDILNEEVEILETTITYKQDNIENNKQEETPICKKIDGEWYVNKEMAKWLNKQYSSILNNKQDKIKKIDIDITEEAQFGINAKIIYKINEIIEAINER